MNQAEEATCNELDNSIRNSATASVSWDHSFQIISHKIDDQLSKHILNRRSAALACHSLEKMTMFVYVSNHVTTKGESLPIQSGRARTCLALTLPQRLSEVIKTT